MNSIASNIRPQTAALAMRDLAKPAARQDGPAANASSASSRPSDFSKELAREQQAPAVSKNSSDSLAKSNSPVEQTSQEESGKTSANQDKALQIFLNKMQSELGVNPEQIVEAFAKLDTEDLALPAHETIGKVIGELNLPAKDKEKAEGFYGEMLALSAAATMSQYLQTNNQTAQMEVLSPKEASRRELNRSIGLMSDNFFNNGMTTAPQETSALREPVVGRMSIPQGFEKVETREVFSQLQSQPTFENAPVASLDVSQMTPEQIAENPMPMIQTLEKELATLEQLSPNDPELPVMKQTLMQLKETVALSAPASQAPINAPKIDLSAINAKMGANAYAAAAPTAMTAMAAMPSDAASSEFAGFEDGQESSQDLSQLEGIAQNETPKNSVLNNKDFIINAPKPTAADIQANVKELINQAQFLAKNGGGEMKVKLNPHGLGEVNLKVASTNGQLNIEMITTNDEAKKVLEKGISELKANLAEHKLQIEHIKIEAPKESSNQMSQQFDQADRHFQQRFLQDFKDQNSNFRREFFDIGPARTPGSNVRSEASNTTSDPTERRKAARRLDLVA